jgi:hypothetical protein
VVVGALGDTSAPIGGAVDGEIDHVERGGHAAAFGVDDFEFEEGEVVAVGLEAEAIGGDA